MSALYDFCRKEWKLLPAIVLTFLSVPNFSRAADDAPPLSVTGLTSASAAQTSRSIASGVTFLTVSLAEPKVIENSIGMRLVEIPAGQFQMGSPDSDEKARDDEKPQHLVKITKPFLMGEFEVTQDQYLEVQGTNPSWFSETGSGAKKVAGMDTSRFPVEQISWEDADKFCKKLSERSDEKAAGRTYRLPTEAEWQYSCRAGTTTVFHYGDSLGAKQANMNGRFPYGDAERGPYLGRTTEVGSYEPNAFGLYDMHGNVAEYCSDWFGRDYYQNSPTEDPQGPEEGADRLVMGGYFSADGFRCRCAHRRSNATSGVAQYFGFRVVCDQ